MNIPLYRLFLRPKFSLMNKIILICIAILIVIAACHKKTVPAVAAPAPPATPVFAAADIAAGKTIYETKCIRCHKPKPVENYTSLRWVSILKSMAPKSKLDSVQTAQVRAYVQTNAKKG